jgi:hypothetical protein
VGGAVTLVFAVDPSGTPGSGGTPTLTNSQAESRRLASRIDTRLVTGILLPGAGVAGCTIF